MLFIFAKIPIGKVFAQYRFMVFLIALVVILQTVFGGGLITGLMIACRIVSLCVLLPLLTMTTSTGDIALCLTRLGFNYKTAYIITSAFNILPLFQEDARQLIDARRLRGYMPRGYMPHRKNVFANFGEYAKIALPLMIKAMRRAAATGLAMDARAFGAYRARTWRTSTWRAGTSPHETGMSAVDFTVLVAGVVYAAIIITINFIKK
jgi:energy-coupling factor transporter transmembrane protein EcfT